MLFNDLHSFVETNQVAVVRSSKPAPGHGPTVGPLWRRRTRAEWPTILAALAFSQGCSAITGLDEFRLEDTAPSTTVTSTSGTGGMAGAGGVSGTGGTGGIGSQGGSGGSGGSPPVLDDTGLIARYYIDEAADGLAAAVVEDAAPMPMALPLDSAGASVTDFHYVELSGHRGLRWEQVTMDSRAAVVLQSLSNKFFARLDDARVATLEAVIQIDATADFGAAILSLGRSTGNEERFSLFARKSGGSQGLELRWDGSNVSPSTVAGAWDVDLSPRRVVHLVLDTEQPSPEERLRLYVDAQELGRRPQSITTPEVVVVDPIPYESIDFFAGSTTFLVVGNRAGGYRSAAGVVFYAAIYDVAFTAARVEAHAGVLLAIDDEPPL